MTDTVQAHVSFSRRACAARRAAFLVAAFLACSPAWAGLDEFRIKREAVYAFVRPPQVTQEGDRVQIRFETKGFCDVTIAIEEAVPEGVRNAKRLGPRGASNPHGVPDTLSGRIVRHLASGVLGPNAPEPFARDSKSQTIVWDGKDDRGTYIDDKSRLTVRVSLGLDPKFERTLFWNPYKRIGSAHPPIIAACPEGVLVYEGQVFDSVRLYDHEGRYVRTVYPFPADKVRQVSDLNWHTFPQDGARLPLKQWFRQATLLSSGTNAGVNKRGIPYGMPRHAHDGHGIDTGQHAASGLAVRGERIALAMLRLNRLNLDGSTGGLDLNGPKTCFRVVRGGLRWRGGEEPTDVGPHSMALSPDGRHLYMAAYQWTQNWGTGGRRKEWLNVVMRLPYDGDGEAEIFAGDPTMHGRHPDSTHFRMPTSVACDRQGRVYVSDYMNDRIQVYRPNGSLYRTIPTPKPTRVAIHERTNEIYVFSWLMDNSFIQKEPVDVKPILRRLGPVDDPREIASYPLPLNGHRETPSRGGHGIGYGYGVALDSWTDPPTIWLYPGPNRRLPYWEDAGIQVLAIEDGHLVVKRDFGELARRALPKSTRPRGARQRLYVDPGTGKLYVADGSAGGGISSSLLVEIEPESGRMRRVTLPFDMEDMIFDLNGVAYLRGRHVVARFNPSTWKEVAWDYGEHRKSVNWSSTRAKGPGLIRLADLSAGLRIPMWRGNVQGGIAVSPKGHLVVAIRGSAGLELRTDAKNVDQGTKAYQHVLYPGRSVGGLVIVFDEYGKMLYEDAIPGIAWVHGIGLDKDDNVYVAALSTRGLNGEPYFNPATCTLMKFGPKQGRIFGTHRSTAVPIKMEAGTQPKRPPDLFGGSGDRLGNAWVEGAEWFYGGVGYNGRHRKNFDYGCDCWNSNFALDGFARSFAPEMGHYSVAVLDTNGNLITRVGAYGNADDGVPLKRSVPKGVRNPPRVPDTLDERPPADDGVRLFYTPYVATHTDRRLFIADVGNARIVSVKLDYHATESVPLKTVTDTGK